MKTPQRYMQLNSNIAHKQEGCFFETIDLKNVVGVTLMGNTIKITQYCPDCHGVHSLLYYPNTDSYLMALLINNKILKIMNQWAKYREKIRVIKYKKLSKEITHTQTFYREDDFMDDNYDDDEDDYDEQ